MEYIYAIDGDDIGKKIEYALFNNDLKSAANISSNIELKLKELNEEFSRLGAETIFLAGDSLLVRSAKLISLPSSMFQYDGMTFSMGIANTPSKAVLALKKAKGLGKNRIISFIGDVEYER